MSVYGHYPHKLGTSVNTDLFLVQNTMAIGERMGFAPNQIHIESSDAAGDQMVAGGCRKRPFMSDGKPLHPECEMVMAYNKVTIGEGARRLLENAHSNEPVLIFLWSTIAVSCRTFAVDALEIPDEELLPINLLTRFNISPEKVTRGYEGGWNAHQTKAEADSLFCETYSLRLVSRCCATNFATCNIPPLLAQLATVRKSTWKKVLDPTLSQP